MRKAFAETLYQLALEDPRLIFLTGDLGFQVFDKFSADFRGRYINVGVAEAQMVSAAAGLAMVGWRPIVYSIASFMTARPYEQIRYCVGYPHLPVTVVGAGRGLLYSTSGVSHHALDDIALMSAIPGMSIVIPGDGDEVRQLMPQILKLSGPVYFSIGKYGEPTYEGKEPAVLGKARLLQDGDQVAIISTGEITYEVSKALSKLTSEGIFPAAYQMHTVKPLDVQTLIYISKKVHTMIIVDEHLPAGGLWSQIANWKVTSNDAVRLIRLGPPDEFIHGSVEREELRHRYGYNADAITSMCRKAMVIKL